MKHSLLVLGSFVCLAACVKLPFEPWGYHTKTALNPLARHATRWSQISDSIYNDVERGFTVPHFTAIDYGSNEGFFSLALAKTWPSAEIISLDANSMYHGEKSMDKHRVKMREFNVSDRSNYLCERTLVPSLFDALLRRVGNGAPVFDYTLLLSVFHWLPLKDVDEFRRVLVSALLTSRVTFVELPEGGHKPSANYAYFSRWYGAGANIGEEISKAGKAHNIPLDITDLGSNTIDYGPSHPLTTTRRVYRVEVLLLPAYTRQDSVPRPMSCFALNRELACLQPLACAVHLPCENCGDEDMSLFAPRAIAKSWSTASVRSAVTFGTAERVIIKTYKLPHEISFELNIRHGYESAMARGVQSPFLAVPMRTFIASDGITLRQIQPDAGNESLTTYASRHNNLRFESIKRLALDMAHAVEFAHGAHIALLDLHPGQFVIDDAKMAARLIDFDGVGYIGSDGKMPCKCLRPKERAGGVVHPERRADCNVERRDCTPATDILHLGQVLAYLVHPALVVASTSLEDFRVKLAVVAHTSSSQMEAYWKIVAACVDVDSTRRPSALDVVAMLEKVN